jgi:F0F1-type ATP synthase assembly protein I
MKHLKQWLIFLLLVVWFTPDLLAQENNSATPQVLCVGSEKFYRVDPTENAGAGTTNSTYAWSVISGPFAGTITTNQGPVVAWTAPSGSTNRIKINWGTSPAGNYQIQVIETSGDGCEGDPIILDVILTPLTVPNFTAIDPICQNAVAPSLPGSSLNTITGSWSPASINTSAAGTFNYTFTPDAGQCADVGTLSITINALPSVNAGSDVAICPGGSATLTASGANSYVWSPATGLSATTGASVTASPSATTTYTVTGTDGNSCSNSDDVLVTVNPLPNITTSGDVTICNGETTSLTASGATNYVWSPASGLSAVTGSPVAANPSATTTYTVTGTDANNCSNTASLTVTVNPQPTIALNGAPTCATDLLTYSVNITVSGGAVNSTAGTVSNTSGNNWSITAIPTGTNITATVVLNGCDETLAINAPDCSCPPIPAPNGAGDDYCAGTPAPSLVATTQAGLNIVWYNAASGGTQLGTGSPFSAPAPGTYYAESVDPVTGCVSAVRTAITLTEYPAAVVNAGSDQVICEGESVTLTAQGASSFTWSPATGLSATTGASVTATPPNGVISYLVTGTDGNGCIDSDDVQVTVNPEPTLSISGGPTCSADLLTWSVDVSVSGGTVSSSSGIVNNTGGNNWTISGIPSGTSITLTVVANGCDNTLAINAPDCNCPPVNPPVAVGASYCAGSPIPVLTATVGVGEIVNWYDAATGGTLVFTGSPFTPSAPGIYYAEAVNQTTNCVSSTRTPVALTENALPNVNAGIDAILCEGESTSLTASGAVSYTWSPSSGLSATTGATVTATPLITTTYTVTGTDGNNCVNTDQVLVTVNPRPVTSPIFHD